MRQKVGAESAPTCVLEKRYWASETDLRVVFVKGVTINEQNLIHAWHHSYSRIIIAQLAPTGLLITTVALLQFGLGSAELPVRMAAVLILLASGILGALAEFSAADEAVAIAAALAAAAPISPIAKRIAFQALLLPVVKYLTPAIFVVIFVFLAQALLFGVVHAG